VNQTIGRAQGWGDVIVVFFCQHSVRSPLSRDQADHSSTMIIPVSSALSVLSTAVAPVLILNSNLVHVCVYIGTFRYT
jgi:hypothetical protein